MTLLDRDARQALVQRLLPLADIVTPNIPEAEALTGAEIRDEADMRAAAQRIAALGASRVVVKGGHLQGAQAIDLFFDGTRFQALSSQRIATLNTHGTGCTFSSAIAAFLARGFVFADAVEKAKRYVTGAIAHALNIGKGHGPTHHFHDLYARAGISIHRERSE